GPIEIVRAVEAVAKLVRAIENGVDIINQVHDVGRRIPADQERWSRTCVDDAIPGVKRNGKERARLPLEYVPLHIPFLPNLAGAAPLDRPENLLIHVAGGIQGAAAGYFGDERVPLAFRADELDKARIAAHAFPRR